MLRHVKIGDRVRSCLTGWGTVVSIENNDCYSVIITFDNGTIRNFSKEGKYRLLDESPEIVEVQKKKKWEPKGGTFLIDIDGVIANHTDDEDTIGEKLEGRTYPTRKLAEKAHKMIRPYQRLVAYVLEHAPNYEPDWNNPRQEKHYVYYNHHDCEWQIGTNNSIDSVIVYMPKSIAEELCGKLNSGEVKL